MDLAYLSRSPDIHFLKDYCQTDGPQLVYVRGRRRVGKSWLLKDFAKKNKNCLYYMGAADATTTTTLQDFARVWDGFSQSHQLSLLRPSALNWPMIFQAITDYLKKAKKPLILILDEIQWIAKTGSGFVGKLKEAWLDWEPLGNIKIILCGSSNKFFHEHSGGEEKVLRGMRTQATIWVKPFTLAEVSKYYFSAWLPHEACLAYMMLGGIPYYLNQVDTKLGFIQAINKVFFIKTSLFLEEADEILGLEFNRAGRQTVKVILSHLGQDGTTQERVVEKTGLSPSSISETLEKLMDYGLVFAKLPAHKKSTKRGAGYRYYMKDFFLNFYFQILEPLQSKIKDNKAGLIFPCETLAKNGYYVPNFSGKAFELLIRHLLENYAQYHHTGLIKKLLLHDANYDVTTYWDTQTQIDLLVEHKHDRISRVIECKWVNEISGPMTSTFLDDLLNKAYTPPAGFTKKHFLMSSIIPSPAFNDEAKQRGVTIITLNDLI